MIRQVRDAYDTSLRLSFGSDMETASPICRRVARRAAGRELKRRLEDRLLPVGSRVRDWYYACQNENYHRHMRRVDPTYRRA
jgi:hypothetical protein